MLGGGRWGWREPLGTDSPVVRRRRGPQHPCEGGVEAPRQARRQPHQHDDRARDPLPEPHMKEQFAIRPPRSVARPVQIGGCCACDQLIEIVTDPRHVPQALVVDVGHKPILASDLVAPQKVS